MSMKESTDNAYENRLEKLKKRMSENDLNGIILVPGPNLRYYTGVSSFLLERPFLFFVPKDGAAHLLAPKLESGPYLRATANIILHDWDDSEGPSRAFENIASRLTLQGKWGLEGRVPFRFIHQLMKHANPALENAEDILQSIRELKEPREIKHLVRAASILCKSFLKIPDMLRAGINEAKLARKIREQIYSNGAESADDILVQSGQMAADPHHLPSSRKLRPHEPIVVDATCTVLGYYADITRTFILGNSRKFESLYANVLEAQEKAIKASMPGSTVGSVDHAARVHLRDKGLSEFFIHRTGHGLGLEVHETPYIIPEGEEILQPFMAFTVEPGVYIPGKLGLRIEDNILVTQNGYRVITKALPKEFDWWR